MKIKDLPPQADLTKFRVKLPAKALKQYKAYAGGESIMYIVGGMMGDFFMSPDAPTKKGNRRLYPMPTLVTPQDILNWTIV